MVSVIIPVYNAKQYICEAVASVLKQDVDMEILILDDGSNDGSMEVLRAWLGTKEAFIRERRIGIHLIENPNNLGVAETRNKGVRLAKGKYVAFLDADDRFADGKLKQQLAILEETGVCLCNTGRVLIHSDGSRTETVISTPEKITLQDLEKSNYINCSSVVVKRDVMLRFPMEHSDVHEDYLTWLRILKEYDFAVGINQPLLEYRLSEHGKSRNKLKSAWMTYRTYRYAGYPLPKATRMMFSYTMHGLRKYSGFGKKH